jgi:hypothetical protein
VWAETIRPDGEGVGVGNAKRTGQRGTESRVRPMPGTRCLHVTAFPVPDVMRRRRDARGGLQTRHWDVGEKHGQGNNRSKKAANPAVNEPKVTIG